MSSIEGGIADKTEDYIERIHQVGKRLERKCQCVTDITQSQTLQSNCKVSYNIYCLILLLE